MSEILCANQKFEDSQPEDFSIDYTWRLWFCVNVIDDLIVRPRAKGPIGELVLGEDRGVSLRGPGVALAENVRVHVAVTGSGVIKNSCPTCQFCRTDAEPACSVAKRLLSLFDKIGNPDIALVAAWSL
jgi:hypothetical protein